MAFFIRRDENTYEPTEHCGGAWSDGDYHFAPLGGLIVHELERDRIRRGRTDMQLSRVSIDILGRLPFDAATIEVEILRPGRTIELVRATATIGGRQVIEARAWYLIESDTGGASGLESEPLPAPEECQPREVTEVWGGGYIAQVQARQVGMARPGRSTSWLTSPNNLVEGEEPIAVAEFFARIDTANGLAVRHSPEEWAFPNVDLTVHFYRVPSAPWTGLDVSVDWGTSGVGVTSAVLHDELGPVGRAEQSLTLREQ